MPAETVPDVTKVTAVSSKNNEKRSTSDGLTDGLRNFRSSSTVFPLPSSAPTEPTVSSDAVLAPPASTAGMEDSLASQLEITMQDTIGETLMLERATSESEPTKLKGDPGLIFPGQLTSNAAQHYWDYENAMGLAVDKDYHKW